MTLSKKLPVLAALAAFMFIAIAAIKPTDDGFKNLKVLPKNITADSLDGIMDSYKLALGVKCGFCHVMKDSTGKEDYASDANPHKETTRNMMLMTIDINTKYFPSRRNPTRYREKVKCITCHQGNQEPPNPLRPLKGEPTPQNLQENLFKPQNKN